MARHRRRRHHRRHYGSIVQLPFSGALSTIKKEVGGLDVLIGAAAGLVGSGVVKWAANKLMPSGLPDIVTRFWPVVGSGLAGVGLYMLEKKHNKRRANGHLIGALAAGVAVSGWDYLTSSYPQYFSDVVSLRYRGYGRMGRYGSVIINEQPAGAPYSGLVVNDASSGRSALSNANLAQLGALSMGDDDDLDGVTALMSSDD